MVLTPLAMDPTKKYIRGGACIPHGGCRGPKCNHPCGLEAACQPLNATHYECLCTHDLQPPTDKLKCPKRVTVTTAPKAIVPVMVTEAPVAGLRGNSTGPQAAEPVRPQHLSTELVTAAAATVVVLLLAVGVAAFWCRKWPHAFFRRNKKQSSTPIPLSKNVLMAQRYAANPQYTVAVPVPEVPCAPPGVRILERSVLQLEKELGEGCFGKVYEGELKADGDSFRVAIKMLKSSASREAEDDFMREVEVMSSFHNKHILSLIGIVLQDDVGKPWMVFEFMAHGDLAEVLRANSADLRRPTPGLPPLGPAALHSICTQVASGMAYLAEQHFVHRDLACRNCLVGDGLTVKIADFGMSRDVYTCDYYKVGSSRPLPIRWMSPESILYGRYTLESDVWSFGVVLWEIYSLGRQPYYGYNSEEVLKLIRQGSLLTPPARCPPLVSNIMGRCWQREPRDRIRFPEITQLLRSTAPQQPRPRVRQDDLPLPPPVLEEVYRVQLLDKDQYLLPIQMPPPEYLQTLPY